MNKLHFRLLLYTVAWMLCGCSGNNVPLCYKDGYAHYTKGELTQAVPCYVTCIKCSKSKDYRYVASAYRDLASICHMEGNHKLAYELSERSVDYYGRAGLTNEQHVSLCRSAVYNAYAGNIDEAITQLRHTRALAPDDATQKTVLEYEQLIQNGTLPVMSDSQITVSASELYHAVAEIKYELYKKPVTIKVVVYVLLFMLITRGLYTMHKKHLSDLQKEKEVYNQRYTNDIHQICEYLRTHPEELKKELHWGNYAKMCSVVNLRFGNIIEKIQKCAALNETETRLCVLVLINLPRNQIAEILPYASNSVGKLKNTVAKKMQTDGKNLHDLLVQMAIKKNHLL